MGPLGGIRVVELAGKGAVPLAATLLADLGADVVRVDRPHSAGRPSARPNPDLLGRGRRSLCVDHKHPEGAALVNHLVERADVLVEGFRPGVAERLGLDPQGCLRRNPRLVYGRITGWGRQGPLRDTPGHDLNFAAVAGGLHPIGASDRPPPPPLNLVGDAGGGGVLFAFGLLAALLERERSGQGQVVDAAMVDGIALTLLPFHGLLAAGRWSTERQANLVDGGAPFYRTYRTSDGRYVSVGALEPEFYAELLDRLGLVPAEWPQHDRARWSALEQRMERIFGQRTRAEWTRLLEDTGVCFAPVLDLHEAADHRQLLARSTYVTIDGVRQAAPAPRFGRTPPDVPSGPPDPGAHTREVLREAGYPAAEIDRLAAAGVVRAR